MFARISAVCFLLFLVLSFASPESAFAKRNNNYILLKGGTFQPDESTLQNINNNFTVGLSYGHWFWEKYTHNLGFEIEGNWSRAKESTVIAGRGISSEWNHYAVLFSLKYGKTFGNTEVYFGGGPGFYAWESKVSTWGSHTSLNKIDYGLHVKAGFTYAFPSGYLVGLEGKYTWINLDGLEPFGYDVLLVLGYQW